MKRVLKAAALTLLCAVLALGAFTACAGDSGDGYSDVIDWDAVDWEGKNDRSNAISLFISNDMQYYYAPLIEEFRTEFPSCDVTVRWGSAGDGIKSEQTQAIAGGNPPDLILGGDVHLDNQKGFLLPLNKLIERDDAEVDSADFLDGLLTELTSGEGIYYLPTSFNVSLLMYNKTLFNAGSVGYPDENWTLEDFESAAKALTKQSGGAATQWGSQSVMDWWTQWYSLITQAGGNIFNANGYVTLNNSAVKTALTRWTEWSGIQGKTSDWAKKIGTNGGSDGGDLGNFAGGKVGMLYSAHAGQLMTFSNSSIDFDIAPLPKYNGSRSGTEMSVSAYGIHKSSKNKKGAWELLKWLTAKRAELSELADFANPVPRKSERDLILSVEKAQRLTKYKNVEVIYNALSYSKPLPKFAYFEEVTMEYIVKAVNKIVDGTYTVDQAVAAAETDANSYIDYRYKSDF